MWTGDTDGTEVKTSYKCVLELRECLDNTMRITQAELLKSRKKNKTLYDRRAKRREFQEGDKVLLLLPTDTNKLVMQWKEPYEIMSRCGKSNDYRVEVNKKVKTFHANVLKKYIENIVEEGYGSRPRLDFWRTSWDQEDQSPHSNKFLLTWHTR